MPDPDYGGGNYNSGYGTAASTPTSSGAFSQNVQGSPLNTVSSNNGYNMPSGGNNGAFSQNVQGSALNTVSGNNGYSPPSGGGGGGDRTTPSLTSPGSSSVAGSANAAERIATGLNAGLGRPNALNTASPYSTGVLGSPMGASLGSFSTATAPAVRNYLSMSDGELGVMDGSSSLARQAMANMRARDAIFGPPSSPNGYVGYGTFNTPDIAPPSAPDGAFGPRTNPGASYLSDATGMGMIVSGMPSPLSGATQAAMAQEAINRLQSAPYSTLNLKTDREMPQVSNTADKTDKETPPSPATEVALGDTMAPFTVGGAPYYGPTTPRSSMGASGANPNFTPEKGRAILDRAWMKIYNRGQDQVAANDSETSVSPSQQDVAPSQDGTSYPSPSTKPSWTAGKTLANVVLPGGGLLLSGANYLMKSRWDKMTEAERQAMLQKWDTQNRAALQGDTTRSRDSDPTASSVTPPAPPTPPKTPTGWEKDALSYGYSKAQLNDPATRALIKQLWDMGFIPH